MSLNSLPPLALYVHLPWCARKCPYCDFNSHVQEDRDEGAYIDALLEDLNNDLPLVWGRSVHSIFFGGGTPSLFSARSIDRLLSGLRACLPIHPACEITLEANPGSADEAHFHGYREAGVNRLSIGVQSFDDDKLHSLGRVHDRRQAFSAFDAARRAGFDNINIDLMFSLPGQTRQQANDDLEQALALQPEHLSRYQLTLEPNTLFHHHPPPLPDDETRIDMEQQGQEILAAAGYRQYEVSAYAREGRQCRHNRNYWEFGDYIGIGAGAHGKISLPAQQAIVRRSRLRQPKQYLESPAQSRIGEERRLTDADRVFEFMLNALRLREGFAPPLFEQRTGLKLESIQPVIDRAMERELLESGAGRIRPTPLGWRFLNDLQALFLDIEPQRDTSGITPIIDFDAGNAP